MTQDNDVTENGENGESVIDGEDGEADEEEEGEVPVEDAEAEDALSEEGVEEDVPTDGECPDGMTMCLSGCSDLDSDPANCGECGRACDDGSVCSRGECLPQCDPGLFNCSGACVDLMTDPYHCGTCTTVCPGELNADPACEARRCTYACWEGWYDFDDDPGCETACTFVSEEEVCNGLDDNCDGAADEGFDCPMDLPTACTTTCDSTGTGICGPDCTFPPPEQCNPPGETCNGLDDDCDGEPDNGFECVMDDEVPCMTICGTPGTGLCTASCTIPTGAGCSTGDEICNGLDDNCNGEPDETFDCVQNRSTDCTTTCGSTGTGTCGSDCSAPEPSDCLPPAETCNGSDDDCDGSCDNTFGCCRDRTENCTTSCGSAGSRTCSSSCAWGSCTPPAETCNGSDDDCDGSCDETFACCSGRTENCTTSCGTTGSRTCNASCSWGSCTPPAETCNGSDDDCDGSCDETFPCCSGRTENCTTSCGTTGSRTCNASCSWSACAPPAELCNGRDDDCDGACDEGWGCCSGSTGTCTTSCGSTGSRTCNGSCAWGSCAPPAETCNGSDDDCDGSCDEGFACCSGRTENCTASCGTTGSRTCSGSCAWGSCTPPAETCNGGDDDCDGFCDDGFACCSGTTEDCTTACGSTGSRTCSGTCSWSTCTPPAELCNGRDDDCDGSCDEGWTCCANSTGSCTTSCGSAGTRTCTGSCSWGSCTPPAETCNGVDDDCDVLCDEIFTCCAGTTGSCTTSCGTTGSRTCTSSCGWGSCIPPVETCNGHDDNCNGVCDEGWTCCSGISDPCTTSCGSQGTRACRGDCTWEACTPPVEACNGSDDDCDGSCDEGWTCCAGTTRACSSGLCSGTQSCTGSCAWGTCNLGAAPSNDTCAGALNVGPGGTFSGTTCGAADNYSSPSCGGSGAPDVVYRIDVTVRSNVVIDTCSTASAWDTVLYLRSGTCTGAEVACNDSGVGCSGNLSKITTTLDPGTYYIFVDGKSSGLTGAFTLFVSSTPAPPPNDTCSGAVDITSLSSVSGDTTNATDDAGQCRGSSGYHGLWYRFTLSQQEVVYFDTQDGQTWDSVVSVNSGSCSGTNVLCVDDTSTCSVTARGQGAAMLAAGTYYVLVSGYFSTSYGAFTLHYMHSRCPGATQLALYDNYGTTSGTGNDTSSTCYDSSQDRPYFFTLCGTRTVTLDTCYYTYYDSVIYLRSGGGGTCGSTQVACDDDGCGTYAGPSWLSVSTGGPNLYFAVMDGYGGDYGDFDLYATY